MTKITVLNLIIDTVAVYRLTKLVNEDKITEPVRDAVAGKYPPVRSKKTGLKEQSLPVYLINCPWCVSIWAAGLIFTLRRISPGLTDWLSSILAASAVTGVSVTKRV